MLFGLYEKKTEKMGEGFSRRNEDTKEINKMTVTESLSQLNCVSESSQAKPSYIFFHVYRHYRRRKSSKSWLYVSVCDIKSLKLNDRN